MFRTSPGYRAYILAVAAAMMTGGTAIANLPIEAQRRLKNASTSSRKRKGVYSTSFKNRTQNREIARHLSFKAKHGHFA